MEKYTSVINRRIDELTEDWDYMRGYIAEQQLRNWMNQKSKHKVIDFFDHSDNRICYVRRLYRSRVDCFYEILKSTTINLKMNEIMTKKSSIVSFGCGPGPEIVAYICYVRNILNCKYHQLDITAIDCLAQWKNFIDVVADLDPYVTIKFQAGLLCNQYLVDMKQSDVCIMSYPHAMNFEDIWENLKRKFTLIIFIDQAKGPLLQIAALHNFKFVDFQCKGSKTFFYHIDKDYGSKCRRQLHDKHSSVNSCRALIDIVLSCGHTDQIFCYQDDHTMKMTKMCQRKVRVNCVRNLHNSYTTCGLKENCQELIATRLECGHFCQRHCDESSKIDVSCEQFVTKICPRGIHKKIVPCSSSFVCLRSISLSLSCGHKYNIRCSDDDVKLRRTMKCHIISEHKCRRGLHDVVSECGSVIRCDHSVEVKQKCGHSAVITCDNDETADTDESKCLEMVRRKCARGLHWNSRVCSSPLTCMETIKCRLVCGHVEMIKCCEDECDVITSANCGVVVEKKCRRNIHVRKQKCCQIFECTIKCVVKLQCGCRQLVKCDDYEGATCEDDCKEKAKSLYRSSQLAEPCRSVHSDISCQNPCNKLLDCGHRCQRRCFQCLNSRLHRPCLEKCPRLLSCGHPCANLCHVGNCENWSHNCVLYKMKLLFQYQRKMSDKDQKLWSGLLEPWIWNRQSQLADRFEKILFDMKESTVSKKMSENYRYLFTRMKTLLNFVDVINDDDFPVALQKYVNTMKVSSVAMIKWLDPDDWVMKTADDISLTGFDREFDRIRTIFTICCVVRFYIAEDLSDVLNELLSVLDSLLNEESMEYSLNLWFPKIMSITERCKI